MATEREEEQQEAEIVIVVLEGMVDSTTTNRRLWLPGRHLDLADETQIETESTADAAGRNGIEGPMPPRRGRGREMGMRRTQGRPGGALNLARATISDRRSRPVVQRCRSQVAQRV